MSNARGFCVIRNIKSPIEYLILRKYKGAELMRFHNINIRNIMAEALKNGGIIVDVRAREEFIGGHIPMAVNLPLEEIRNGSISLPKGKILLLYCETGGRSTLAATILVGNGYRVINTVGGLKEYRGALTKGGR